MSLFYRHKAKWFHISVAVVFVAILLLPLSQTIFRYYDEPEGVEKRKPAKEPVWQDNSIDGAYKYIRSFEAYFNDHFGFRKLFVRLNSLINYHVFSTSPKTMVALGQNGWLYYDNVKDGKNFVDYCGNANFTSAEQDTIRLHLKRFKERMAQRGIPVLFVLIPNKQTIYPEYLPSAMPHKKADVSRIDQVDQLFSTSGLPFIDLRQALISAKNIYPYPIYYKTDSHWTELGTYVGYQDILKAAKRSIPSVSIHYLSDYRITKRSTTGTGDLANLIFLAGMLNDVDIKFEPKFKETGTRTSEKYKTPSIIYSNQDTAKPSLLMFHDSFNMSLRPFLAESFSRCVFLWSTKIDYDIIDKEKPDILIFEFAERYCELLLKL